MKVYEVPTKVCWTGERSGLAEIEGKSPLHLAAPPEFKGHHGVWTPEDLFVEALESCLMLTFVSLCEGEALKLIGYHSQALGRLVKGTEGFAFEEVLITPKIEIEGSESLALQLIHKAHSLCMIRKSVGCHVVVKPEIVVRSVEAETAP